MAGIETAINFDCPNCMSKAGSPCTMPTVSARREVPWFHHSRQYEVDKSRWEAQDAQSGAGG